MCNGVELNLIDGWVDLQFYEVLIVCYIVYIDKVVDVGYMNLICFSGNKCGKILEEGLIYVEKGLK